MRITPWIAAGLLAATVAARAEPGVTADSITFAQTAALSGPFATVAQAYSNGIQLAFRRQNDAGGVNGRKLTLRVKDDAYQASKAITNVNEFTARGEVFGLIGVFGTPANQAIDPLIQQQSLPSIAPYTGSDVTRTHFNPWLFNVRASYHDEAFRIVRQLTSLGITRIGVLYQQDSLGQEGLSGVQGALAGWQLGLNVTASAAYDPNKQDVSDAVKTLAAANLHAVVLIAASKPAANFIHQMKQHGQNPQFFAISTVDAAELYGALKDEAVGVALTQVTPNPNSGQEALVADYQRAMRKYTPQSPLSYAGLEGFLAGQVAIEGLRKAGSNPTRRGFVEALEALGEDSFGGFPLRFENTNHRGSNYVDVVVMAANGRLKR